MQQLRQTAQVNLRVDPALKAAVEAVARQDQRTLVEMLVTAHLKAKAYLE